MEPRYVRSKSTSRMGKKTPLLPAMMGLQKMMDQYISMYEYEKTKSIILDEEIRELTGKITDMKRTHPIKKVNDDLQAANSKLQQRAQYLEHQLEITLTKVNKTSTQNRRLRDEIDTMRLNSMTDKEKIDKLSGQVDNIAELKEQEAKLTAREFSETQRLSKVTTMLRSRSTNQRLKLNEKIMTLTTSIKNEFKETSVKVNFADFDPRHKSKAENFEPVAVLKKLKAKWDVVVAEQKTKVDELKRNLKVMRSGLEQIRSATGMQEIEEIVTTFVKSEDQNYSLSNYISSLNREIEQVEKTYQRIIKTIEQRASSIANYDDEVAKTRMDLKNSIIKEEKRLHKLKLKSARIDEQLKAVEEIVSDVMETFVKNEFTVRLPEFISETDLKSNLLSVLLKLEVYIDEMVIFKAFTKQEQSPALKLIAAMANKIFHREREPAREVIKINEILATAEDFPDEPMDLQQFKRKAKEKIDLVNKMNIDEIPNIVRRKNTMQRSKTPGWTPREVHIN